MIKFQLMYLLSFVILVSSFGFCFYWFALNDYKMVLLNVVIVILSAIQMNSAMKEIRVRGGKQ